jgi:hypothetical protein
MLNLEIGPPCRCHRPRLLIVNNHHPSGPLSTRNHCSRRTKVVSSARLFARGKTNTPVKIIPLDIPPSSIYSPRNRQNKIR